MKTGIITVKTITLGLKGKRALSAEGIKSRVVKIDATESKSGCQYGLEFNALNYYDAIRIMRENGIEYGVYKTNDIS